MSVRLDKVEVRSRAIGMLLSGKTQKNVALSLGKDVSTIQRWWYKHKAHKSLQHRRGAGRPKKLSRVSKIVIAKSLGKRHKSTRSMAKKLTNMGNAVSKDTVHRYLTKDLKVHPYKRPKTPKLTEFHKKNRLTFCMDKVNWTVDDWKRILWSDESPYELFHPSNAQNDRIWAKDNAQVTPRQTVKFPAKVMVWGMVSYQALSTLHILPQKQTINAKYYIDEILEGPCIHALRRTDEIGGILERKMMPDMSKAIFMQDGAPAHTARRTQDWCRQNLPGFWEKQKWPGNSPDLNPIENIWSIVQDKIDRMKPAVNVDGLEKMLENAWASIDPDILERLYLGMPMRIQKCIELSGDYIGK